MSDREDRLGRLEAAIAARRAHIGDPVGAALMSKNWPHVKDVVSANKGAFYCCTVCIVVLDAEKIDQSWSTYSLS